MRSPMDCARNVPPSPSHVCSAGVGAGGRGRRGAGDGPPSLSNDSTSRASGWPPGLVVGRSSGPNPPAATAMAARSPR